MWGEHISAVLQGEGMTCLVQRQLRDAGACVPGPISKGVRPHSI